jgi:hypothetical protein
MMVSISILTHEILYNPDRFSSFAPQAVSPHYSTTRHHHPKSRNKPQTHREKKRRSILFTHSLPSIYLPHPSSSNHPFRNTTHVSLQNIRHTHATHHTTQNNPKKVEQPRAQTAQRATHTPPVPAYPILVHLRPVRQLGPISRPRRTCLA